MNNFHNFSQSVNSVDKILDLEKYNGRINIVENPNKMPFEMSEKIEVDNKVTDFRDATRGIINETPLSKLFFSKENIQIIQNGMRNGVYKMSNGKYVIEDQNVDTLKVVMRALFLEYAKHQQTNIVGQIEELDNIVVDYCVPKIHSESIAYEKYCYDQSTIAIPMELPNNHDRNFKQLQLKDWE